MRSFAEYDCVTVQDYKLAILSAADWSKTHKRRTGPQNLERGPCEIPEQDGEGCWISNDNPRPFCNVCRRIDNGTRTREERRASQKKPQPQCRTCESFCKKVRTFPEEEKNRCPGLSEDEEGGYPADACGQLLSRGAYCKPCKTKYRKREEAKEEREARAKVKEKLDAKREVFGKGDGKGKSKSTRSAPY
eukprot:g17751.t1